MIFLILILAIFYAMNMGGSSFAACFAVSYGGKVISARKARILFILFVVAGALIMGERVTVTLGKSVIPEHLFDSKALLIILTTASLSMFIANMMNIPQSTSLVAVAAIAGLGAHFQAINTQSIYRFLFFWTILPLLSFGLTYLAGAYIYPPRKINFWVYEKYVNHQQKMKMFVLVAACYNAFAIGTNNVANVAGPLLGAQPYSIIVLLAVFGVFYGLGGSVFSGPLKTMGHQVVPLGLLTVSIISVVSGTLMLIASAFGVPQSFVMLQIGALFAISTLKHGPDVAFANPVTRRTLYTWSVNPIVTFFVTWAIAFLVYR